MLTKETGSHPRTSKLTKDMMESGYWIPSKYNIMEVLKSIQLVERM